MRPGFTARPLLRVKWRNPRELVSALLGVAEEAEPDHDPMRTGAECP